MKKILPVLAVITLLTGCKQSPKTQLQMIQNQDVHSYAKPNEVKVNHLDWQAEVNFSDKKIYATANLTLENKGHQHVWLDTKELTIQKVFDTKTGKDLPYKLGKTDPILGSSLKIEITEQTEKVSITYHTSPHAEAVQWLSPEQTLDKSAPFLFTQSQAILARSWVPIQDSPGIRFTYSADVQVPDSLLALMSASNPTAKNSTGKYHFEMKQPIPAYLLALTVGDLQFASLGNRSGVYAEAGMLKKSAKELEDTEQMIASAEELYGAYAWERYDMVVLPPAFPFGGMENPRLTFATPTIIAGDKSLTSLIAHELAHSWSGNLVTNETWDDFWLNEGFTVYFEYRIMESLYGEDYSEMLASLSKLDVQEEIASMNANNQAKDTHLKLDLKGRNPDDGMNSIAYDKGYFLLRWIEEQIGREKWDAFLKNYFTTYSFKTMNTERFLQLLDEEVLQPNQIAMADIEKWVYQPGLPQDCPSPSAKLFEQVDTVSAAYISSGVIDKVTMTKWSTHEWLHFLRALPKEFSNVKLTELDETFQLTQKANAEVFTVWAKLCIANDYTPVQTRLGNFLEFTGRRKFVQPLFQTLLENESTHELAQQIYKKSRGNYHFVTTNTIDAMMAEKGL